MAIDPPLLLDWPDKNGCGHPCFHADLGLVDLDQKGRYLLMEMNHLTGINAQRNQPVGDLVIIASDKRHLSFFADIKIVQWQNQRANLFFSITTAGAFRNRAVVGAGGGMAQKRTDGIGGIIFQKMFEAAADNVRLLVREA